MKEKIFRNWMRSLGFKESTINSRISNIRRIEDKYGDLDDMIRSDKFLEIKESLNYTLVDENNHAKPQHLIPINGNLRIGSAT